ncbi:MAG: WG repeat-containing protein, partial [Bacteroidia bacterium]
LAAVGKYHKPAFYFPGYTEAQFDSLKQKIIEDYTKENNWEYPPRLDNPLYQEYYLIQSRQPSATTVYGYIDTKGKQVIDFSFTDASKFKRNFAKVGIGYGSRSKAYYSYIDEELLENEDAFKEEEDWEYYDFRENLIDRKGILQFSESVNHLDLTDDQFFILNRKKWDKSSKQMKQVCQAFNKSFQKIIEVEQMVLFDLKDGVFYATDAGSRFESSKHIFFNSKGEIINQFENKMISVKRIAPNRFLLEMPYWKEKYRSPSQYGMMDESGNWVLEPVYDFISDFRPVI